MKRIAEHKTAVKNDDKKNGIAVHVTTTKHQMNWKVISNEIQYWRRRVIEAINIQTKSQTMNLDCGLKLNDAWHSALNSQSS